MAVIDLQVSTSCLRACRAAGSRSVDLKASCVYRLSINADGLMSRHTADEPSQSLCSAIAAHPLGRVQRLSSVDFQALCRDLKGAFPDLVRNGLKGTILSGEPPLPYNRAKLDLIAPEPSPVDFDWRFPVMPSWRAADVLKIRLNSEPDTKVFQSTDWPLSEWERFALDDQVVAIRRIPTDRGSISFPDEPSFELRSVSNRDPQREHYTVWTSRGKAAAVAGTRRLAAILSRSTDGAVDASDLAVAARLSQRLGFKIRGQQ